MIAPSRRTLRWCLLFFAACPQVHGWSFHRQLKYITCASTNELVHAIQSTLRPNDVVAEVGAQLRNVSSSILESLNDTGRAVMVHVVRQEQTKADSTRTRAMRRPQDLETFLKHSRKATFIFEMKFKAK